MHHTCRNHGSHFEKAKTAFEDGAGREEATAAEPTERATRLSTDEESSAGGVVDEKHEVERHEKCEAVSVEHREKAGHA